VNTIAHEIRGKAELFEVLSLDLIKAKNLWEMKISGDCSWAWRKMMKLRNLAIDNNSS
jgi:hypothetical protein